MGNTKGAHHAKIYQPATSLTHTHTQICPHPATFNPLRNTQAQHTLVTHAPLFPLCAFQWELYINVEQKCSYGSSSAWNPLSPTSHRHTHTKRRVENHGIPHLSKVAAWHGKGRHVELNSKHDTHVHAWCCVPELSAVSKCPHCMQPVPNVDERCTSASVCVSRCVQAWLRVQTD